MQTNWMKISIMANVKFIYSGNDNRSSTAAAVDLSSHYSIPQSNWNFGFAALNIGSQLSSYYTTKEDLLLDIVIGVSKKLEKLPVRLSVDFHKLNRIHKSLDENCITDVAKKKRSENRFLMLNVQ